MKLLRKLEKVVLYKVILKTETNGAKVVDHYQKINDYNIIFLEINDELSINTYGAEINSIKRISSVRDELENFLKLKMDSNEDNISLYQIEYASKKYKIISVKNHWIDIRSL